MQQTAKAKNHRWGVGQMMALSCDKYWENQGKGLLQVLHKIGWIDESGISKYNIKVVDEDKELISQLLLIHMMDNSPDFSNELSQLEYFCQELGSRAVITPKFHAEYAGEGVK